MGRQNKKFSNTNSEGTRFPNRTDIIASDDGFFRGAKRLNLNGTGKTTGKRFSQHSMRPENRAASGVRKKQFSHKRSGSRATGYKKAAYQYRAD